MNKTEFRQIVEQGPPPGLLVFDGDLAVGWCQLTPRDSLPWLERDWRFKRVDGLPVWCLSCFYVRRSHRRRGITSALIREAVKVTKQAGAPALEAYPRDNTEEAPNYAFTGYASTFARAGFKVVALHTPSRPIMRHNLREGMRGLLRMRGEGGVRGQG